MAVLIGVAAFAALGKEVTLMVDGKSRTVSTFGGTVGDLLEGEGVEVGPHDEISHPLNAEVRDGMRIRVLTAKEITLVLGGSPRVVYVAGTTVEDVLRQVNLRSGSGAYVRPSRGASIDDGDTVVVRPAVSVTVRADGRTRQVITNAPDVGYLLDSMGVIIGRLDRVEPDPRHVLTPDLEIRVIRVRVRTVEEQREVPFTTEVRTTNELLIGQRRVERAGQTGAEALVFRVRLEDGEEVGRRLVERRLIRAPVSQVELVGTRPPRVQTGLASWYQRSGMVAAHPSLPFGTEVTVTNTANGRRVTVVVDDRGPYVPGRIIDLSDDAFAQLAPLGSGTIHVRITW